MLETSTTDIKDEVKEELERLLFIEKNTLMRFISETTGKINAGKFNNMKDLIKYIIKELLKSTLSENHPVFSKTLDWGGLNRLLANDISPGKNINTYMDPSNLSNLIQEVRERLIHRILLYMSERDKRLRERSPRPLHGPGFKMRKEIPNLYFVGENYEINDLYAFGLMLLRSICIGKSVAIYLEGELGEAVIEELEDILTDYGVLRRNKRCIDGRAMLSLEMTPLDKEYTILAKLVIWLYDKYHEETEEERKRILIRLLDTLRGAHGVIYSAPPNKDEWNTIVIPRLERFIRTWVEDLNRRDVLKIFRDHLNAFYVGVRKKAPKNVGPNIIDILTSLVERFYKNLVEYGAIDWETLRSIMDIIVGSSLNYDIKSNLNFIGRFIAQQ